MYSVETNELFYVILQKFSKKNFYLCKNSRKDLEMCIEKNKSNNYKIKCQKCRNKNIDLSDFIKK
jgi:hypothetical protein